MYFIPLSLAEGEGERGGEGSRAHVGNIPYAAEGDVNESGRFLKVAFGDDKAHRLTTR